MSIGRAQFFTLMVAALCALPLLNCGGAGGVGGGTTPPLGCGCDVPGAPAGGLASGTTMTATELMLADQVLAQVNAERASRGLAALIWHAAGAEVAYQHSIYQESIGTLTHDGPGGCAAPTDCLIMRLNTGGVFGLTAWGENVAQGQATAQDVMCGLFGWMLSPGHCANILNAAFTHVGVAVRMGVGGPYWTQVFMRF